MGQSNITRFVVWICRKFSREEIEIIITKLAVTLKDPNAEVKPRDHFKEEHPNYRNFRPDQDEPLTQPLAVKKKTEKEYRVILEEYLKINNEPLEPIKCRSEKNRVPAQVTCSHCHAPHEYLYFNDGKKRMRSRRNIDHLNRWLNGLTERINITSKLLRDLTAKTGP